MKIARQVFICIIAFLMCNIAGLWVIMPLGPMVKFCLSLLIFGLFVYFNIVPFNEKAALPKKIKMLGGGCELMVMSFMCVLCLIVFRFLTRGGIGYIFGLPASIANVVMSILVPLVMLANGLIRLFFVSGQLTATHRGQLLFLWWVPLVNIFVFFGIFKIANEEYKFNRMKFERNAKRKSLKICETKYPLLMVHGIFFRDWKLFNYWGRIPAELEENGAKIYYGNQQSSSSIEQSAEEVKKCILDIIEKENCEKVNIIAHSKGGLDTRYAISCLGMEAYVASLTTINTPHRGCRFAKKALDNLPENMVSFVSEKYDAIFSKLGDDQPDFYSGVSELTDEKCAELNRIAADKEGVLYQSVGSRMKAASSAIFPLNLSYSIVKMVDGENDGLVSVPSMPWGEFVMIEPEGKLGISHGDLIDLTRKDIKGFDVCEFYVGIVSRLKARGL